MEERHGDEMLETRCLLICRRQQVSTSVRPFFRADQRKSADEPLPWAIVLASRIPECLFGDDGARPQFPFLGLISLARMCWKGRSGGHMAAHVQQARYSDIASSLRQCKNPVVGFNAERESIIPCAYARAYLTVTWCFVEGETPFHMRDSAHNAMGKYWALRSAYTQRVLGYSDFIRLGCPSPSSWLSRRGLSVVPVSGSKRHGKSGLIMPCPQRRGIGDRNCIGARSTRACGSASAPPLGVSLRICDFVGAGSRVGDGSRSGLILTHRNCMQPQEVASCRSLWRSARICLFVPLRDW